LGKRFARCLYIAARTRLKTGNCPDVEGSADAAEASSSYIAGMGFVSSALRFFRSAFFSILYARCSSTCQVST
ncbi:hypothetical protein T01_9267, partial [Trichinella spiralis]